MTDYMGKISEKAFENLARASLAQDDTIDTLRAELATVTAERDELADELQREKRDADNCRNAIDDVRAERATLRAECDKRGVLLATVTAERDAWHNDAEAKADALEASRAECNQWARKVATVEAERDALRAKADAVPWDAIGGMLFELRGGRPWHERVKDWYESHNAVGK